LVAERSAHHKEKTTMSQGLGLLLVSVIGGIIVIGYFVQDMLGSLKFWRTR